MGSGVFVLVPCFIGRESLVLYLNCGCFVSLHRFTVGLWSVIVAFPGHIHWFLDQPLGLAQLHSCVVCNRFTFSTG